MTPDALAHALATIPFFTIPDAQLGPLPVHPFGLLVATGIVVGHRMATKRAAELALDSEKFESLVFWTVATGIVLSHMLDVLFYHPDALARDPLELFKIWRGLSSFGGFFGAALGFTIYFKRNKIDPWRAADAIGYGLPVGWLFGRMGCTTVHDHPGRLSQSFLAVAYPDCSQPGTLVEWSRRWCETNHPMGHDLVAGSRLDLGLLELMLTPILIVTAIVVSKRQTKAGTTIATLAMLYPVLRFPLDFFRAQDSEGGDVRYLSLTPGHYYSLLMLALGVALWFWSRRNPDLATVVAADRVELDKAAAEEKEKESREKDRAARAEARRKKKQSKKDGEDASDKDEPAETSPPE